jgi:hypothetical protein
VYYALWSEFSRNAWTGYYPEGREKLLEENYAGNKNFVIAKAEEGTAPTLVV